MELSIALRNLFVDVYRSEDLYRATGIVLLELSRDSNIQYTLFEDVVKAERVRDVYKVMDDVGAKYGKHSLHLGSSHFLEVLGRGRRGEPTARERTRYLGETRRKHLNLPLLHLKV